MQLHTNKEDYSITGITFEQLVVISGALNHLAHWFDTAATTVETEESVEAAWQGLAEEACIHPDKLGEVLEECFTDIPSTFQGGKVVDFIE